MLSYSKLLEYGYGTIAIVFISLLALLGIILLPCFKKSIYYTTLDVLNGLAVGTLFSDAAMHMLPDVLDLKADENKDDSVISVPDYIIKITVSIFCNFFLLLSLFDWDKCAWMKCNHRLAYKLGIFLSQKGEECLHCT